MGRGAVPGGPPAPLPRKQVSEVFEVDVVEEFWR